MTETTAQREDYVVSRAVMLASVAALGGLLFGFDTAVINGAVTAIRDQFEMGPGLTGFAVMIFMGMGNTLMQTRTPDHLRGRAMSVHTIVMIGFMPMGQMLLGSVGTVVGIDRAFLGGRGPAEGAPSTTRLNAASPCQPCTMAPQSTESRSPASTTRGPGMPCTTSSLTEAQIVAGKGGWL